MFYINKYKPKNKNEMYFNKETYDKLETMAKDESIPHIIFYGGKGSGKKTMINIFLEMLYDKTINDLVENKYIVNGSGNASVEVNIKQSNYHIIVEPNNNNFDKYLIQDVVKEYARKYPLNVFATKKKFKIVLINNVDKLSYYAQTSLRRTLEKYSGICRFIMWCESLSRVINPLKSRCYCFKIKSPKRHEMLNMLSNISEKEKIYNNPINMGKIIETSESNMKIALWKLNSIKYKLEIETSYDKILKEIIEKIIECKITELYNIRDLIYKVLITNISGSVLIKDINNKLLEEEELSEYVKCCITEEATKYEHKLIIGRREIIHLEGMIISIMDIIINNKE